VGSLALLFYLLFYASTLSLADSTPSGRGANKELHDYITF